MSDIWYREPLDLPAYRDGFGQLWTLDGKCLNPLPEPEPAWYDGMDIEYEMLQVNLLLDLFDLTEKRLNENL